MTRLMTNAFAVCLAVLLTIGTFDAIVSVPPAHAASHSLIPALA